jgi:hypothetical protein
MAGDSAGGVGCGSSADSSSEFVGCDEFCSSRVNFRIAAGHFLIIRPKGGSFYLGKKMGGETCLRLGRELIGILDDFG